MPLLFAYGINRFSHDVAQFVFMKDARYECVQFLLHLCKLHLLQTLILELSKYGKYKEKGKNYVLLMNTLHQHKLDVERLLDL